MTLRLLFVLFIKFRPERALMDPDLCDTGAVLQQLSYQANWERVVMWVDFKQGCVEWMKFIMNEWPEIFSPECNECLKCHWNEIFVSSFIRPIYSFKRA